MVNIDKVKKLIEACFQPCRKTHSYTFRGEGGSAEHLPKKQQKAQNSKQIPDVFKTESSKRKTRETVLLLLTKDGSVENGALSPRPTIVYTQ